MPDPAPQSTSFGQTSDGRTARLFTLQSRSLHVAITDFGGRVVSLRAPDQRGEPDEILLGFDSVCAYANSGGAFGALLGRTANRIAGGAFNLNGRSYQLPQNDRHANLHGGPRGFDQVYWSVEEYSAASAPILRLVHTSPRGDQGFPGELTVQACYRLQDETLWLTFTATTDEPTPVSLSAHPYFNLSGSHAEDVLDHWVNILAESFLPTDEEQIPTGEIRAVQGTVFDFRAPRRVGQHIRETEPQLRFGCGYDHYYVLDASSVGDVRLAARAVSYVSGRSLEILTTQRGLQFYTGNQLKGSIAGRSGLYRQSAGLAFEPQEYPDAVHHAHFPSNILVPGQRYSATIGYRFSTVDPHSVIRVPG